MEYKMFEITYYPKYVMRNNYQSKEWIIKGSLLSWAFLYVLPYTFTTEMYIDYKRMGTAGDGRYQLMVKRC